MFKVAFYLHSSTQLASLLLELGFPVKYYKFVLCGLSHAGFIHLHVYLLLFLELSDVKSIINQWIACQVSGVSVIDGFNIEFFFLGKNIDLF